MSIEQPELPFPDAETSAEDAPERRLDDGDPVGDCPDRLVSPEHDLSGPEDHG